LLSADFFGAARRIGLGHPLGATPCGQSITAARAQRTLQRQAVLAVRLHDETRWQASLMAS